MKRYESRYCTFAVPDDWEPEPPFAFRERGDGEDRLTVQILERSLLEMPSAAVYARDQKPFLEEIYKDFELLREGPHLLEGLGEGYFLLFRFLNKDGHLSQCKTVYLTCGPLALQLALIGLDGPSRERDRLFEAIGKTFSFRQADFLAGVASATTSKTLQMSQAEAAKNWPGTWRKFPRACVHLPTPIGWDIREEERGVCILRGNTEIRLHRELGETIRVDAWLADRLKRLQISGDRLLNVEKGEIKDAPYAALLYEEKGTIRAWKTAATTRVLDLFVESRQALLWTLRGPESNFSDIRPIFESLVVATSFLDPADWETPMAEDWLDYTFKGPWEPQGHGAYLNTTNGPVLVHASESKGVIPLSKLRPSMLQSFRREFDPTSGTEDEGLGLWKGNDAFHFAFDGRSQNHASYSTRALCLNASDKLRVLLVKGQDRSLVEPIFRDLLESIR